MSYLVLARRYRPQRFSEVVGQEVAARALRRAVAKGRLAHAYLFAGIRGVGKTTLARILAAAVNCAQPEDGEPCLACEACRAVREGTTLDVVEMDAASHTSVDDVREILEAVRYPPAQLARKVYIVDEAHMLSKAAFNALLKTLEEPPAHALFILATTEPEKVPPTVRSRCQRFDLARLPRARIAEHLAAVLDKEGVAYEPEALRLLARAADGSLRDALSLAERMIALEEGRISEEGVKRALGVLGPEVAVALADAVFAGEGAKALGILHEAIAQGHAPRAVLQALLALWRALGCAVQGAPIPEELSETERQWIAAKAAHVPWLALDLRVQVLVHGLGGLAAVDEELGAELLLLRLCGLGELAPIQAEATKETGTSPTPQRAEHTKAAQRGDDWAAIVEAFAETHAGDAALLAHTEGKREAQGWRVRVPASVAASITPRLQKSFAAWLGEPVRWEEGEAEEAPVRVRARAQQQATEQAWEEARRHRAVQAVQQKLDAKLVEVIPPQTPKGGAS